MKKYVIWINENVIYKHYVSCLVCVFFGGEGGIDAGIFLICLILPMGFSKICQLQTTTVKF